MNFQQKFETMNFLLLGKTGSGKSATGNSILGYRAFKSSPTTATKLVKAGYTEFQKYTLKVIDGPGLEDTDIDKIRDSETAAANMGKALMMCSEGVGAFLYVMSFGSRFTAEEMTALESLKRIFGEEYFNHVIVIITRGDVFKRSMEEEERDITFEEWCREQDGMFNELYKICNERFVLFNNWEENKKNKKAQIQTLIKMFETLHTKNGRYKYESFVKAEEERETLMLEMKFPELTEDIQEKAFHLRVEIDIYASTKKSYRESGCVQWRINHLEVEVRRQNKVYPVLDGLLQKVGNLSHLFDNIAELKIAAHEIKEAIEVTPWNEIEAGMVKFARLLYR